MFEYINEPPKEAGDALFTAAGLSRIRLAATYHTEAVMNKGNDTRLMGYAEAIGMKLLEEMDPNGSYEDITEAMCEQADPIMRVNQGSLRAGFAKVLQVQLQQEGREL